MVSIDTHNACVDFPIFDAKSRSMKKAFLGAAGGAIGRNTQNTVVVEALRDINLHLREGDRVGLVGHNGAGKSTLLRLLSGIYEPTRGSATVRGRVAPVFDLGVGMDPEISGYENIIIRGLFLGQTRRAMRRNPDRPVRPADGRPRPARADARATWPATRQRRSRATRLRHRAISVGNR